MDAGEFGSRARIQPLVAAFAGKRRLVRTASEATFDFSAALASFCLALIFRSGPTALSEPWPWMLSAYIFAGAAAALTLSRRLPVRWRRFSMADLLRLVGWCSLAVLLGFAAIFAVTRLEGVPRSAPFLCWMLLFMTTFAPRVLVRLISEERALAHSRRALRTALVLGPPEAIVTYLGCEAGPAEIAPMGCLLPQQGEAIQAEVEDIPVLGTVEETDTCLRRLGLEDRIPDRLLVVGPLGDRAARRGVLQAAARHGLPIDQLRRPNDDKPGVNLLGIEDLLHHQAVDLTEDRVRHLCHGRRVLVTGAGGSIGSKLAELVAELGPSRLVLVDHGEYALYKIDMALRGAFPDVDTIARLADVRDSNRIRLLLQEEKPEVVIHAAALKHVPLSEINVREAVLTNAIGTAVVAEACVSQSVGVFVLISTDKAVDPTSVMGASKRAAEMYCQALDSAGQTSASATRFVTVRFGNVFDSTGSVVPLFRKQIQRGGPLTITHPGMRRYFMTIGEACGLVLTAAALAVSDAEKGVAAGSILELDMGDQLKILDLARAMVVLAGKRPGLDIAIETIGIRPGEKLFEDAFHSDEPLIPTDQPGVVMAQSRPVDLTTVRSVFKRLEAVARTGGDGTLVRALKELIPEFHPASLSRPDLAARDTAEEPMDSAVTVIPFPPAVERAERDPDGVGQTAHTIHPAQNL